MAPYRKIAAMVRSGLFEFLTQQVHRFIFLPLLNLQDIGLDCSGLQAEGKSVVRRADPEGAQVADQVEHEGIVEALSRVAPEDVNIGNVLCTRRLIGRAVLPDLAVRPALVFLSLFRGLTFPAY